MQAVPCQDDATLLGQKLTQTPIIGQGQGQDLVGTMQQVGASAWGDVQAAMAEGLVAFRNAAVSAVAEIADVGKDIAAELLLGQSVGGFGSGSVGLALAWTVGMVAASDVQREANASAEGGDRTLVLVVGPQALNAVGAMGKSGLEVFAVCRLGPC